MTAMNDIFVMMVLRRAFSFFFFLRFEKNLEKKL